MDYNHINSFLGKFKEVLLKGEETREAVAIIISKNIGVEIVTKMIRIKSTTIYIDGSGMLKSEILMHKQSILRDIIKILPMSRFTDIR